MIVREFQNDWSVSRSHTILLRATVVFNPKNQSTHKYDDAPVTVNCCRMFNDVIELRWYYFCFFFLAICVLGFVF